MRWMIIFIIFTSSLCVNAQVKRVWIGDTSLVNSWSNMPGDTTYRLKTEHWTSEWMLFYDIYLTKKAVHVSSIPHFDSCWYRNGQLKSAWYAQPYCPNCVNSEGWYPNGQQEFNLQCNSDSCLVLWYYPSGQLQRKRIDRIVDSARQLPHYEVEYHENGQLKHTPIDYTSSSVSTVKYFYASGEPWMEYQLIRGHYYGQYIEWHPNGQIQLKGRYKKRKYTKANQESIKVGRWQYFNESGQLLREERYRRGKLVNVKEFLGGVQFG